MSQSTITLDNQPISATNPLPTTPAATELHLGEVGGNTIIVGDETTRVSDGNAYTAGDAISATTSNTGTTPLRSLAVARVAGGSGYITKIRLMTDQVACVAQIRVHFYTVAAPAAVVVGDNVPMTLMYANKAQRIGHVDLTALTTSTVVGSTSDAAVTNDLTTRLAFKCANGDQNIYYRLETLTTFTPNSEQHFYIELAVESN